MRNARDVLNICLMATPVALLLVAISAGTDLATGAGVGALMSIANLDVGGPLVILGGSVIGVGLTYARASSANTFKSVRAAVCLMLSAAQLFLMLNLRDPDIGASLAGIPLFLIACIPPPNQEKEYTLQVKLSCLVLNVVVISCAIVYFSMQHEDVFSVPTPEWGAAYPIRAILGVTDAALATAAPWPGEHALAISVARGVFFVVFAVVPRIWLEIGRAHV